jgi:hypothetical protein
MPNRVRVENGIMHQRLLLGTTALVGAGMLFTNAAMAQDGGLEVVLGGFTEFGVAAASHDTLANQDASNQNYSFFMDSEIIVRVNGLTDGGVRYGSKVELEVGADNGDSNASIDEVGLFFSGNFGRVELGRDDGAEDGIFVGAEDAQAGTVASGKATIDRVVGQISDKLSEPWRLDDGGYRESTCSITPTRDGKAATRTVTLSGPEGAEKDELERLAKQFESRVRNTGAVGSNFYFDAGNFVAVRARDNGSGVIVVELKTGCRPTD